MCGRDEVEGIKEAEAERNERQIERERNYEKI
jgi:hypothetical protein